MRLPPTLARVRRQLGRIFRMPFRRKPAPRVPEDEVQSPPVPDPSGEAESPQADDEAAAAEAPEAEERAGAAPEPTQEGGPAAPAVPRDYEAIGRVAVLRPVDLPRTASGRANAVCASAGTPVAPPAAPAAGGQRPSQAPVPPGVINMHRQQQVPPNQRPAQFRVSEYPGPEADDSIDVTDDLYGYLARTINLKLRISAARQEG